MRQSMRFRCWDQKLKEMIPSFPLYKSNFAGSEGVQSGDLIVMAGTGLKDKTGTPIFEGDIIKITIGRIFQVLWDDDEGLYYCDDFEGGTNYLFNLAKICKVIGNIHQHKELLK